MNSLQLRKRAMYEVVEEFLATVPAATIASMPNFEAEYQNFTAKVSEIRAFSASQTTSRLGYSIEKNGMKVLMVAQAIDVASRIKGFARNTGNDVLEAEMNQRISFLGKKPDSVCADICSFIYNKGVLLLSNLASYGVTQSMLSDLETAVNNFTEAIPKPKEAIDNRVISTKYIALTFVECNAFLKTMDILADMLRYSDTIFYDNYFQRRKMERPGYRTIDFMGIVTDSNGIPLEKVTVKINDLNIERKTTDRGYFEIKSLPSGIYNVTFIKAGYINTVLQVAVTNTQRTEINVVLVSQSGVVENVA